MMRLMLSCPFEVAACTQVMDVKYPRKMPSLRCAFALVVLR
jgi:hypothetical protein